MASFTHLRTASGFSLKYGASPPDALVRRAAAGEMDSLALTDRDGLYGAVRFVKECLGAGIAPIVGADMAVGPQHAANGRWQAESPSRVVVLAEPGGWPALCRMVSAAHAAGARGKPLLAPSLVGEGLQVLLGHDSAVGRALADGREDQAVVALRAWQQAVGAERVSVAVSHHQVGGRGPGSVHLARRMRAFADERRVRVVLTHGVRMARREDAPTCDILDATRRLVPLGAWSHEGRNAEGYLKSGAEMARLANEICDSSREAGRLLAQTYELGLSCRLDPHADVGLGQIHLPEFDGAAGELRRRCETGLNARYGDDQAARLRLDDEIAVIEQLGFAPYFLTVARVVDEVKARGIRVAARGSGAGSLVNYVLGISGVDPLRYGLLMERFLSPQRRALPDIDLDVESARREEIYDMIFDTFGASRVACVAMMDTYRVRHAIRDVGAALGLPPSDVGAIATAFPHVRARNARQIAAELPELRQANMDSEQVQNLLRLAETLDGLPRHIAMHPCGVLLSDAGLGDRTPIERSLGDYPMSQFDKDDVEDLGLLKLDVLGIRMQSAMAHAVSEIERGSGECVDLEGLDPFDDPAVYEMISRSQTLGCFQIESPGQRELLGKFGPSDFTDIIIDISLFRPGPVKSDMVVPFLKARNGWSEPQYLHPSLIPVLRETRGVVVFHEQIIQIVAIMTGCSHAEGDEARRALSRPDEHERIRRWFTASSLRRGYERDLVARVWEVLKSFASFGFCKAHAAAFGLTTYQSAWLKRHYPAAFLAGILTHDPGMYPKRLLLEEARQFDVPILPLDINRSGIGYHTERDEDGAWGIRLALSDVKGITSDETSRVVRGRPYGDLTDFWKRAGVASDVGEALILTGAFDTLYGIREATAVARYGTITRRDLLLRWSDLMREGHDSVRRGRRRPAVAEGWGAEGIQMAFDFDGCGDDEVSPVDVQASGLPELSSSERLQAELEFTGLDASAHVLADYEPFLAALGIIRARDLLGQRSGSEILVAGVKVATQTPPVRSGKRVIFTSLDDATGVVDLTFFPDVQGPFSRTVFTSWLLIARGAVRRTGPRGVSLLASGAWDLGQLRTLWQQTRDATGDDQVAVAAVHEAMGEPTRRPSPAPTRKLWHSSLGSPGR